MRRYLRSIREQWWAVVVIAVAAVAALVVAGYLLVNQRVPLPWQDSYTVRAEFANAQAVVGGQGQQVTVAGVPVGEISDVRRTDRGTAIITMRLRRDKLDAVHRDARLTLRPRTALQDMAIDVQPGRRDQPKVDGDTVLPIRQTTPQVQIDEVLASVDADTRVYLQQFLAATAEGLDGESTERFRDLVALAVPTGRQLDRVLSVLRDRRRLVRTGVHRIRRISEALDARDGDLSRLLDAAARTFTAVGRRDAELRSSLTELPPTLSTARSAVGEAAALGTELRRAAPDVTTALRATADALPRLDPLLRQLPGNLRPLPALGREGAAVLDEVTTTLETLRPLIGDIHGITRDLAHAVNILGHNPEGPEEGYLFWLAWFAQNGNSMLSTQDALGQIWRGQLMISCVALPNLGPLEPAVKPLLNAVGLCR
ncbi:MAG: MlaD family protein [Solirubrobacteraceae bacterium]|nr:MlaD family protein [Solirubrobacteraceae bacterium]